ncbi:hypothetical protein M5Y66_09655 [Enterobacter vonholyi]|uniref:hypothetical protein n=1 Tax=Enterobacter vonholyi TaxID=2797505 RepID=UPI0020C151B9|nr:hypothetical protein [Enterobacter vonholyi]MCL5634767.1 hypothetical protein [Enterobacter vonholyi]
MEETKCPHCGEALDVGSIPRLHMERYGRPVLAKTVCCGKAVRCTPYLAFNVRIYDGPKEEDDWGAEFND